MKQALYVKCTDHVSVQEHEMLDHCFNCAPWWNRFPICPVHKTKLNDVPTNERKGYCKECKTHYEVFA